MIQLNTTLLAISLLAAPAAQASDSSPAREALRRHCTADYMEHCSEHPPGGPAVEACFRAKARVLTPGCATAITAFKREQKTARRVTAVR